MKRNERIQWLHKKITDKAYPNAHRLAEKKLSEDFSEEDLKKLLYKNGFNV